MTAASPDRGAFLRERLLLAPLRVPLASLCPGWPAGATAALFHRCARQRLDLFSTAFAGEGEAARALTISAGGCLHEHDCGPLEHPVPRNPRAGRLPCSGRKSPSDSGQPPEVLEVRGRETDARHSRSRLLVTGTSPQPRSLRAPFVARRRPPAGLERRGGETDAAGGERACKARSPTGRWSEGYPRRCPALTGPRCLLSQGRSRANGRMPVSRS